MKDTNSEPNTEPGWTANTAPSTIKWRWGFVLPLFVFAGLAVAFGWGLTLDPSKVPSVLIGKTVPRFELPPVQGRTLGLSSANLKGEVSLVNVFASWCTACRAEHPLFMRLKTQGIAPIHGLNYKDKLEDAAAWLDNLGDPYTRTGPTSTGASVSNGASTAYPRPSSSTGTGRSSTSILGRSRQRCSRRRFFL